MFLNLETFSAFIWFLFFPLTTAVFLLVSAIKSSRITKNVHEVSYLRLLSSFSFYIQLLPDWYCM